MIITEFRVDSPILQEALTQAPTTTVTHDEEYQTSDGIAFLFWVKGDDLTAFDDGLSADSTVTNPVQLAETRARRLYRVTFTDRGESVATFQSWAELNISLLRSTATHEGWNVRMRMPDRETLEKYRETCAERDLQFQLQAIYETTEAVPTADATASTAEAQLTDSQRKAFTTARELGYFQIPREASLADVADHCEVSSQAVSERLRRGTATLVDTVL